MVLIHASSFENKQSIQLVSIREIRPESEPHPTTSNIITDTATPASAVIAEIKNQISQKSRNVNEGDEIQEELDGPTDTHRGEELTGGVTIEEVVIPKGNATQHPRPPPPPQPTPPSRQPCADRSASTTAMVAVVVAALSQATLGTTLTWSHALLPQLATNNATLLNTQLDFPRSFANLGSYLFVAGLVTSLVPSGWVVASMGRRRSVVAAALLSMVSWGLQGIAPNAIILLIGRFVAGLSAALLKVSVTTFVTEVMVVTRRGQALVFLEMVKITGALLYLCLSWLLPWYYIALVNLVWMMGCGIAFIFLPESPVYLLTRDREEEAHEALRRLRSSSSSVEEELQIIKSYILPKTGNKKMGNLFPKSIMSHILSLLGVLVVSVFAGSAVIMSSGADMLLEAGFRRTQDTAIVSVLASLICGSVFLFGLVDRIGRRLCLLVSLMILVLIYSGLGAISYVAKDGQNSSINAPTLPAAWVTVRISLILLAAFSLTLGTRTMPTILAAEYFPAYCRPQGLGVFFTASALLQALSLGVQPLIQDTIGLSGLYWVFSVTALLGIFYTNFCVYEIKYKTQKLNTICKWLFREHFYEPRPLI